MLTPSPSTQIAGTRKGTLMEQKLCTKLSGKGTLRRGVLIFVVFLIATLVTVLSSPRKSEIPTAQLILQGYTNRNSRLFADLQLTNPGPTTFSYDGFLDTPMYYLDVDRTERRSKYSSGAEAAYSAVLRPGETRHFRIELPQDATCWKLFIGVHTASRREVVSLRLEQNGLWNNRFIPFKWLLQIVPNKHGAEKTVVAGPFYVPSDFAHDGDSRQ